MPFKEVIGVLNDIGTEELAHLEMISAIVHQLTRNMTIEQIKEAGFDTYFVDHTADLSAGSVWYTVFRQILPIKRRRNN